MTVISSPKFHSLNSLRPANAGFGEVVSLELYFQGESLGYSKRKSIHVPPSSNAYWNFVGLRSFMVKHANEIGMGRHERNTIYQLIEICVRWVHESELKAVYQGEGKSKQYYDIRIEETRDGYRATVYDTFAGESREALFLVW